LQSEESSADASEYDGSDASDDSGSGSGYDDDSDDGDDWEELERKAAKCMYIDITLHFYTYLQNQPIPSEPLRERELAETPTRMMTDLKRRKHLPNPRRMAKTRSGDP
jgi:hypothetical protein